MKTLFRNDSGAALVEYSLIFPLLLIMTFAIVEFGSVFFQWNSAEKATQLAVRLVSTWDPVVTGLSDCGVATTDPPGTDCRDVAGAMTWKVTCNGASPGGNCDTTVMDRVVTEMQRVFSRVQRENLIVEFSGSGLGFVGRGSPVPLVTVKLQNMTYNFVALDGLLGFGPLSMPTFTATAVGEDLGQGGS